MLTVRETHKKIVLAMAENDMKIGAVARQMNYHRNTVDWHLHRIQLECGLDPKRFYDLVELVKMAKEGNEEGKDK